MPCGQSSRVKAFRECVDPGLRGRVHRPTGPGATIAGAGNVDDLAIPLSLELRGERPAAHDSTGKIEVEDPAVDGIIHFFDRSDPDRPSGVVDEEINFPKIVDAFLQGTREGLSIRSHRP